MKNILAITTIFALGATTALAQDTTQAAVLGETDDAVYSLQVQGANGVIYNCMPEIEVIDGVNARRCITAGSGGLAGAGNGLTGAPAVAAGILAVLAIAANDDGSATTTTGSVSSSSDVRLKQDIVQVGTTTQGLPLYHFSYIGGKHVFEGVMAQDVLSVMPGAVSTMDSGYMAVDYGMLGLEMRLIK